MAESTQARAEFPTTREAALTKAKSTKVRAAARAAVTVEKVKRFAKRDCVTCATPVGTMRVRSLLAEAGTKLRNAATPRVRGK
jgi:hypothetical protein